MSNIIAELEAEQMSREVPEFGPGDTVKVNVKVAMLFLEMILSK